MEFRILGTLEVSHGGNRLPIGKPRVRTVLGVLLAKANEIVSIDHFVDELWPEEPPQAARAQVHDYVSRLRRALRGGRNGKVAATRLVTRKPGYLLEVCGDEFDWHRFERLLAEARAAYRDRRFDRCLQRYRAAHRLWRGPAFCDVPPTPTIGAATVTLSELHVTSLEDRFEIALECHAHDDLVVELTKAVTANPLRERLISQLMRALHRTGRTADALALSRRTRQRLVSELGIEPSRQLQRTELAILRGEPDPGDLWRNPLPPLYATSA